MLDPISLSQTASGVESAWRSLNAGVITTEYDMPPNYYAYDIPDIHGPTVPSLELQVASEEGWGPN